MTKTFWRDFLPELTSICNTIHTHKSKSFVTEVTATDSRQECRKMVNQTVAKQIIDMLIWGMENTTTLEKMPQYRSTSDSFLLSTEGTFHDHPDQSLLH